jgi:hypothetical protein
MSKNKVVTDLSALTEAQAKQVKEIKAVGGDVEVTKCHRCGKLLIRDKSIEQEAGDLCAHLDAEGITPEALMAHRATMSATVPPEGYIKVADLHKICVKHGIPVARMVKAIGGDRSRGPILEPRFTPVYVGQTRWLDPWCSSKEALDLLKNIRPTKADKAKAELSELENVLAAQ